MDLKKINQKIRLIKRQNGQGEILEENTAANPFEQFLIWFDEVLQTNIYDPSAMVLATVDENGLPDSRVVLLKELQENNFIFYTNYGSKKARELFYHPVAALNFYWPSVVRQVRIRGKVEKLDPAKSAAYFKTRPRDAQLGVYSSRQSTVIPSREFLDDKIKRNAERFLETEIECPAYWGGYVITPFEYEFFLGRAGRTHDRIFYKLENNGWKKVRLSP